MQNHFFFFDFISPSQTVVDAVEQAGGIYLITADHGNAEEMVKKNPKTGKPVMKNGEPQILTSHTLAPVKNPVFFTLLSLCHWTEYLFSAEMNFRFQLPLVGQDFLPM